VRSAVWILCARYHAAVVGVAVCYPLLLLIRLRCAVYCVAVVATAGCHRPTFWDCRVPATPAGVVWTAVLCVCSPVCSVL
jgi:hypothetical protein